MHKLALLTVTFFLICGLLVQNALAEEKDRNSRTQGFFTVSPYAGKVYLRGQDDARTTDAQGTTVGFSLRYFTMTQNTDNVRYEIGYSSFISALGNTDATGTYLRSFTGDLFEVGLARGLRDPLLGYISLYAGGISEELTVNGPGGASSQRGKRRLATGLGFGGMLFFHKIVGLSLDANRLFFNSDYAKGSFEFDARLVLSW